MAEPEGAQRKGAAAECPPRPRLAQGSCRVLRRRRPSHAANVALLLCGRRPAHNGPAHRSATAKLAPRPFHQKAPHPGARRIHRDYNDASPRGLAPQSCTHQRASDFHQVAHPDNMVAPAVLIRSRASPRHGQTRYDRPRKFLGAMHLQQRSASAIEIMRPVLAHQIQLRLPIGPSLNMFLPRRIEAIEETG